MGERGLFWGGMSAVMFHMLLLQIPLSIFLKFHLSAGQQNQPTFSQDNADVTLIKSYGLIRQKVQRF
jgi:hypothetical protein